MIALRYFAALITLPNMLPALVAPALAAETTPSAPPAPSLQDQFNVASDAANSGRCKAAIPMFEKLEADPRIKPGSLPAAAIAMRHGRCLLLDGKDGEGEALVRAGLPKLDAAGADFADEVALTSYMMGQIAFRRYDHDAAVAAFTRAAATTDRNRRLQAMVRLAQATMFDGDGAAVVTMDKALAETSDKALDDKELRASFLGMRGRALMNLGRLKEAEADLGKAIYADRRFTSKIKLADVALRSDMAQVLLLMKKPDQARFFIANTGAGRIAKSHFDLATYMGVPECTGEPGLRPEDSAVVEFSIGTDGHVASAQTVYTRGTFAAAKAFAEEVRNWAWKPDTIASVPRFYTALVRVEMHCSNASSGLGEVLTPLRKRFNRWAGPLAWNSTDEGAGLASSGEYAPKTDALQESVVRPQVIEMLRAAGSRYLAEGNKVAAGAAFGLAGFYEEGNLARKRSDLVQAISLIGAADPSRSNPATVPMLATLRTDQLWDAAKAGAGDMKAGGRDDWLRRVESALMPGLSDPLIQADALAQDTLRISLAKLRRVDNTGPEQIALLRAVADDTRLENGHPLRQIALLRLANAAAAAKQYQEAEALFSRTGLTEQQCALIGDIPQIKSDGASSHGYPWEAQRMGFEGWVRVEYDIDATGRTANQRALIAYPPFVFVDAAKDIARGVRYDASYRPSGKLACSATSGNINFKLHDSH